MKISKLVRKASKVNSKVDANASKSVIRHKARVVSSQEINDTRVSAYSYLIS